MATHTRKRTITYALKSWKETDVVFIIPEAPMALAEGKPQPDMEPPTLLRGIDLDTGEPVQIVVPIVLKSELEKAFPNDGYVGVKLEIHKKKVESKRYSTFEIYELE